MAEEDLIFGKKRHLFGGIEPSNMVKFEAVDDGTGIFISAMPPSDSIVDGQTLCTVAGVVIRRKENDFPKDEFDGEFVVDVKNDSEFKDDTAVSGKTYFYRAFPYTTQGVYNRNKKNTTSVNVIPALTLFESKYKYIGSTKTGMVEIKVQLPSSATGVVIRKSVYGYPETENDGDLVVDLKTDGTHTDNDVIIGETYYYSAFTYNDSGLYYRGSECRHKVKAIKSNYYFGFNLTKTNSNPSNRVVYPEDVENHNYTPAKMNYKTGKFNYGGWNISPGDKFMPRPCMLRKNGTVAYYLNPNNYKQKDNGTSSDVTNVNFDGNAMMEWPKIYTKRWEENGVYKFRCSDVPYDDTWDCWCNYDVNNNQIDHFYMAIYDGYIPGDGCLRSISGLRPTGYQYLNTYRDGAHKNGDDWEISVLADHLLIQDLMIMIGKSTNTQTVYGYGQIGLNGAIDTGVLDDKGLFYGQNDSYCIKVFGIENYWGNMKKNIVGWFIRDGIQMVKITKGTHDGTTSNKYNNSFSGYITLNETKGGSTGYIKEMLVYPFGRIPFKGGGSSSTYEADEMSGNYDSGAEYVPIVGGSYYGSGNHGGFFVNFGSSNYRNEYCGACLSCKPKAGV